MKKTLYLLSHCYLYLFHYLVMLIKMLFLNPDSLSDAQVSIDSDTGRTQIEVINTNQDGTAHIYYNRL